MKERRRHPRRRRRMPCELWVGGRSYHGFVLDLSERGLYVQTSVAPRPGEPVRVQIRDGADGRLELEARVARRYAVPQRLASVVRGGVGLRLTETPPGYERLVAERGRPGSVETGPVEAAEEAPRARRFRVLCRKSGSARSRSVEVEAATGEEARAAARRKLGEGWEPVSSTEQAAAG